MLVNEQARNIAETTAIAKDAANWIERAGETRRANEGRRRADLEAIRTSTLRLTIIVATLFFALGFLYGRGGF